MFEGVGQEPGLKIWRIENFEAVPYDEANYGKFYVGDSYIVLKTFEKAGRLKRNVFFWLGSETSQDEAGTAAIKTIELDDQLGGLPIQYREVQGHESPLFTSCFKNGIKYLPGGIQSGFTHIEPDQDPDKQVKRLLHLKGKRNLVVNEVPLAAESIIKEDCYILDHGKGNKVYLYIPTGTKSVLKFKAGQLANEIRDEDHAGDSEVVIYDGSDQELFFDVLGFQPSGEASDDDSDDDSFEVTLYKVKYENDDLEIAEVAKAPFKQDMLKSDDCFIVNSGKYCGLFVWIGKDSNKEERKSSMKIAGEFISKQGLPKWTKVARIVEGGEPSLFKGFFSSWKEEEENSDWVGLGRVYPKEKIAEWDVACLHAENRRRLARAGGSLLGFCPDDGSSTDKQVWRIEGMEMVSVSEELFGKFFGGDSYVVRYSYQKSGGNGHIVYFWQGLNSSQDEKAASAINAVKVDDELGGAAIQIRVVQGQEPRHFLKIFGGKTVVFSGGKASGFKNLKDHDTYDVDGTQMFRVRGTDRETVRIYQVPEESKSLNSDDVFILESKGKLWIWNGKGASDEEKSYALDSLPLICDETPEILEEGNEPEEFWTAIGGQGDYDKEYNMDKPILLPRLFHCAISSSGKIRATEIADYTKNDLITDDVMILDSGDELYVWIGKGADSEEKTKGMELAQEYLRKDPTHRNEKNTIICVVKEEREPSSFTCLFPDFN